MEVTALCIRLLMTVLTLPCSYAQKDDATLSIQPNRLQFFEYEPVTFHCEGFHGSMEWKIVHWIKGELPNCDTHMVESIGLDCNIKNVYSEDSGEYWCESARGRRSNRINITVITSSVILESPALPVREGNPVILRCRNKTTSTNLSADFYKDGLFNRSSSMGEMIIYSVSKHDEGLYNCNISGAGGSPESWLAVRDLHEATRPSSDHCSLVYLLTAVLAYKVVLVVLLLLLLGLRHHGKIRGTKHNCRTKEKNDVNGKEDS
ncbi:low affinity immunoglobulin gamma Fc region receptor II-b-like [Scomber japonicus]|uniref:low affinity immunoglobulin gamma Fc region receptor II-b-like n=1 Tax=Scomber japonicus TaxID=13676 RepID=UPI002305CF67|nr:low affinity immunoglobulin gamma Fc region receptor II-b-like [Scomber japonicus]